MSKKKITGDSKLAGLAERAETEKDTEPEKREGSLRLVTKKMKITPTSFRLTPEDRQGLKYAKFCVSAVSENLSAALSTLFF